MHPASSVPGHLSQHTGNWIYLPQRETNTFDVPGQRSATVAAGGLDV